MNVQVLISCMFDSNHSIIKRTNLQSDAIVVNQCDNNSIETIGFYNRKGERCKVIYINTTERGLSKSRNLAISHSYCGICLICDDDEVLDDDYVEKISTVYEQDNSLDVVAFKFRNHPKKYPLELQKIGLWKCARISSIQITFKRSSKIGNKPFREDMGAGSGNGAGEENKFLVDLLKKKARIYYYPIEIGTLLAQNESTWFNGYTRKYHIDRGWATRQIYGFFYGVIYMSYSLLFRIKCYDKVNSWFRIFKWTLKGFFERR